MSPELPAAVVIPETVAWQQFSEEVVLVDFVAGEYHTLNNVASRMWQALDECENIAAVYAVLCDIYDVDADRLRADLHTFILNLLDRGLLSPA